MTRSETIALFFTAVLLVATGAATSLRKPVPPPEPRVKPASVRALLDLAPISDTTKALVTGYHYHLLQRFAVDNDQTVTIRLAEPPGSGVDSLRAGAADLVLIPFGDGYPQDSLLVSRPVDSLSLWLMRPDDPAGMRELNDWIAAWHASDDHAPTRELYLRRFNAFRSGPCRQISPYDSLIRAHADSLGWDWHLLAAVIYQESRFHIEAVSPRGAAGLMQMMPGTAAHYGVTDPLDPEMNIAAGARSLGTLIRRYYPVGDNMTERYKYALAAYNAGIGRIDDCINLARWLDVDTGYWINIVNRVLPLIANESVMATGAVRLGPFRGEETAFYVNNAIAVYDRLRLICP